MPHPFADLGNPIIEALGAPSAIVLERRALGSTSQVDGLWVQGALTSRSLGAVVQPSGPKEIERLPEGERTKEAITVWTLERLETSDVQASIQGDVIVWNGRRWRVSIVEDWTTQAGYCRSVAVRLSE